jgi:GNAT superfamily N-acetyltransferase
MQTLIRTATEADLKAVRDLVLELAVFEREPEAVTATEQDYHNAYLNNEIYIKVAEANGEIIGMVLYYLTFSTWKGKMMYLEDFYVKEAYRKLGVGAQLFNAFLKDSRDRGCVLTKWQVLDWNTSAVEFYEARGAEIDKQWWNGKMYL